MSQQQQTVLRVQFDNVSNSTTGITEYIVLDTYSTIPIKINRSYAELQDIGKKNSDYSIGIQIPGSKKNNRFFENFFNVDTQSLYFNAIKKAQCDILINDEPFFTGYLRLNKVSVINSKVEYDVSLYNTVGNLFGDIGTTELYKLNWEDSDYFFNHRFNLGRVTDGWYTSNFSSDSEQPQKVLYPIVHNGYLYTGDTVNVSGGTAQEQTRLYTSSAIKQGAYANTAAALADGVLPYRINTPNQGIYDNQLKPALSVWNLIKLMFKTYGYTIKSDFFNTPWMKSLYMYGYFSSPDTKFAYTIQTIETLPLSGIELIFYTDLSNNTSVIVTTLGTGIPCYCSDSINYRMVWDYYGLDYVIEDTLPPNISGYTYGLPGYDYSFLEGTSNNAAYTNDRTKLRYFPKPVGSSIPYIDGDYINFSVVVDPIIKQIDVLSSIAKKFNLVFVPDPDVKNQIIIEPFTYYIGTGEIYDWTDKISFDKGFTVEPALNYVESSLIITDLEDGDYGNQQFKNRQNRIYGQLNQNNPTDFKSQEKRIETIFSPEIIRQWDTADQPNSSGILIPLGINYAGSSNTSTNGSSERTNWNYSGVKTKPKLMWYLQGANVFNDYSASGITYNATLPATTYNIWIGSSSGSTYLSQENIPVISHTMPIGMSDKYKINNDSACLLFNSEQPTNVDVPTYNVYTDNDSYGLFYSNRVNNLYDANTRFLNANFYLKINEYKNLKPNDLIKINDQFFIWNKINGYNLTNTELTQVELVQIINNPLSYPTRYFKYQYCDQTGTTYCVKTDFTNPNMLYTQFGWSVTYDFNSGLIYGTTQPTGYTSTISYDVSGTTTYYVPYFIKEISQDEFDNSGYVNWTFDTLMVHIYGITDGPFGYNMPTYWFNSGGTITGLNLFKDCSTFASIASANHIRVGNSEHFGPPSPISKYHSGVTLNITDTGWIKYTTEAGQVYKQITSLGTYVIPDCADCDTVIPGFPFADVAVFTITSCGTPCG
jgi:hypothetical protein